MGSDAKGTTSTPKAHWDIAADLGIIDFARGAKVTGSGFVLYKGRGARLERGLIAFMIDLHITKHGYTEWSTPFFLSRESMRGSCHLAKFTPEMYHDAEDDLFALPTAEPALINIHRDEILDGRAPRRSSDMLPIAMLIDEKRGRPARTPAALASPVHQFDKVEMVKFTHPESSYNEMEILLSDATDVLDALGLPYRIKLLASGDISFAASQYFTMLEIYAPGADMYGWKCRLAPTASGLYRRVSRTFGSVGSRAQNPSLPTYSTAVVWRCRGWWRHCSNIINKP